MAAIVTKAADKLKNPFRLASQRIHVLGQWRRKAELPSSMRDIGTVDLRIGFNRTQIGNDGAGVMSEQGALILQGATR